MLRRTPLTASVALLILSSSGAPAQGPQFGTPQSVGIDYPIVACKMPEDPSISPVLRFPDGGSSSLQVGAGVDLVIVFPDGSEQVLVDASVVTGNPNASCVDPCVSFDGTTIYFSIFENPRVDNLPNQNRQVVPAFPAHIWSAKLESLQPLVTATVTRLTSGIDVAIADQSRPELPHHKQYDVSPIELPDDRLLFLSNRSNAMNLDNRRPAMRFYRMHKDGSNIEPLENFTMESCQHPIVLMDGRIVWTHTHIAARRGHSWDHPLMIARPDMAGMETFAGAHYDSTILHFLTQMAPDAQSPQGQGDITVAAYYGGNNFGHGSLIRFPLHNPSGAANVFKEISDEVHTPDRCGPTSRNHCPTATPTFNVSAKRSLPPGP